MCSGPSSDPGHRPRGAELLDQLHGEGFRTREYLIFGDEWWLYVLNRIAEDPTRVITALADLREGPAA
ncbi:hypothetical protein [Promicromonospora kroppenstedtii]|uniref:hypothetical protein n=1 Tax=Promicromonospora kroppenstedtii TaxID=440482 RepID=UPI0004BA9774|nr:hypothetical protein [Promicromonospora kroppenstedtii]